jgi:hypothetical protein
VDLITRSIVELYAIPAPNTVASQTFTIQSNPGTGVADWIRFAAMYNEFRVLSQILEYIPNVSVCNSGLATAINGAYPGIIIAKVARGNTAPTLASFSDVDTACVIEPICFTGKRLMSKMMMSEIGEASFLECNAPSAMWATTLTLFYGMLMPNDTANSGPGSYKITTTVQFRGSL